MADALVLVAWPDLAASPHGAGLVALCLRRRLDIEFAERQVLVWDPDAAPCWNDAGFCLLGGDTSFSVALGQWRASAERGRLLLLMHPDRAAELVAAAPPVPEVAVWAPEALPGHRLPHSPVVRELRLRTANPVTVVADPSLLRGQFEGKDAELLSRIRAAAARLGLVVAAQFRGPGSTADPSPGPHGHEESPGTVVIVADAESCGPAVAAASGSGARIVLWTPDPALIPSAVLASTDYAEALSSVLPDLAPPLPEPAAVIPPVPESGSRLDAWPCFTVATATALKTAGGAATLEALAVHLSKGRWTNGAAPTAECARGWIEAARQAGLLALEPDGAPRLNPRHSTCRTSLAVAERCVRLLEQMLRRIPWVSFKLLRTVLMREQWLGGPDFRLDEEGVDQWLNFLVRQGLLVMTKETNVVNPEHPVAALRLNESHPLVAEWLCGADAAGRLLPETVILTVDHFLCRQHKPWMAMGVLRRSLERIGRDALKGTLHELQASGAMIVESHVNPLRENPTTGCRLDPAHPQVRATLADRDRLLQRISGEAGDDGWCDVSRLKAGVAGSGPDLDAWLVLLGEAGLLESRSAEDHRAARREEVRLRRGDPVVRIALGASNAECRDAEPQHRTEGETEGTREP